MKMPVIVNKYVLYRITCELLSACLGRTGSPR